MPTSINETKKTGKAVLIPIHDQVKAVLLNKGGFHSISDQKFNLYIKEVCKVCGLDQPTEGAKMSTKTKRKEKGTYPLYQLVSSHICRRSFATNLYGKIPNTSIMAVTGHTTESQFLKYIKKSEVESVKEIVAVWDAQKQEEKVKAHHLKIAK